jgi:hypothetical protein
MIFKKQNKGYVSDIDLFLRMLEKKTKQSPSQRQEIQKHQKIAALRDYKENK